MPGTTIQYHSQVPPLRCYAKLEFYCEFGGHPSRVTGCYTLSKGITTPRVPRGTSIFSRVQRSAVIAIRYVFRQTVDKVLFVRECFFSITLKEGRPNNPISYVRQTSEMVSCNPSLRTAVCLVREDTDSSTEASKLAGYTAPASRTTTVNIHTKRGKLEAAHRGGEHIARETGFQRHADQRD